LRLVLLLLVRFAVCVVTKHLTQLLYIVHALFLDSRGAAKLDDDRFKTQAYAKPAWPVTRGIVVRQHLCHR
jgi:hypothetical protein